MNRLFTVIHPSVYGNALGFGKPTRDRHFVTHKRRKHDSILPVDIVFYM